MWMVRPKRAASRVAAVGLAVGVLLVGCSNDSGGGRLGSSSGGLNFCQTPPHSGDWQRLLTTSTQIGLDYFTLSPTHGVITVTKVELLHASAGVHLTHVVFVPGGGAPSGFEWGTTYAKFPLAVYALRRSLPARLTYVPLPTSTPPNSDGVWQLAVGVSLDATAAAKGGGYATGVRITYRSGGDQHVAVGADRFGIFKNYSDCQKSGVIDQHDR
jgi:hypothetical protein